MPTIVVNCTDAELEAIRAGARADNKAFEKWIIESLLVQAECAIDDPRPRGGRPRRYFDPSKVAQALEGRSIRAAARALGVPQSTLNDWLRHGGWELVNARRSGA